MYYESVIESCKTDCNARVRARAQQLGYPAGLPSSSSSSENARAINYENITFCDSVNWESMFADLFGHEPNFWDRRDAAFYLDRGIQPELILLALRDTAAARRPTWTYTVAILRRCLTEGVRTLEDWDRRKTVHAEQARPVKPVNAQRYAQREYTGEELDKLFERL